MTVGKRRPVSGRRSGHGLRLDQARALLALLIDPSVIIDARGLVHGVNAAAERSLGYTAAEVRGQPVTMLMPATEGAGAASPVAAELGVAGVPQVGAIRQVVARRKDGQLIPLEVAISDWRVGGRRFFMLIARDCAARQRIEAALSLRDRALAASLHGVVITDAGQPDNPIIYANPAFERITGYPLAETLGRNCRFLQGAETDPEAVAVLRAAVADARPCQVVLRNYRRDGSPFWNELTIAPVRDDTGCVRHFIGMQIDVSDRRREQQALERAQAEAAAAAAAKSEFLANMSHEIRTPLNAVIGMTGLLLDTALGDEQRDYAETIRASGEALLAVINDILDLTKIEAQRLDVERVPFELRVCLEQALDLVTPAATAKGLNLAYVIEDGTPPAVIGDGTRVRQVLANLLSNAVKFTAAGEVVVTVSRVPGSDDDPAACMLEFAVHDTGIGIPAPRLDRLFQPFSQVDSSTTRQYGGTGLGLAISRRLSEVMGGTMWVESEVGRGSTFRFTVRVGMLEGGGELAPGDGALAGRRILIVDDNATNRRILTLQAQRWGMLPVAAASAIEALDWMRSGSDFDVVALDMCMPEVDGLALARDICKLRRPAPPLVMLTSVGRRPAETAGLAGAAAPEFVAWLNKPIKQAELFDALARACGDPRTPRRRQPVPFGLDAALGQRVPLRILVAEDNPVNQKVARQMLARFGYRADVAANGLEVLQALRRQAYDLVLLDVQMPEMDGLEAARRIRAEHGAVPRLVAITANAMPSDREACLAAGMDDYISKPVRIEELQAALVRSGTAVGGARPDTPAVPSVLDRAVLDMLTELGGTVDPVPELIEMFLDDAPRRVTAMRAAVAAADAAGIGAAAHALRGSAAALGARGLSDRCAAVEAHAADAARVAPLIEELDAELGQVQAELQGIVAARGGGAPASG